MLLQRDCQSGMAATGTVPPWLLIASLMSSLPCGRFCFAGPPSFLAVLLTSCLLTNPSIMVQRKLLRVQERASSPPHESLGLFLKRVLTWMSKPVKPVRSPAPKVPQPLALPGKSPVSGTPLIEAAPVKKAGTRTPRLPGKSSLEVPAPKLVRSTRRGAAPLKKAGPGLPSAREAVPTAMSASMSAQPPIEPSPSEAVALPSPAECLKAEAETAGPISEKAAVAGSLACTPNLLLLGAIPMEIDTGVSSVATEELAGPPIGDVANASAPSGDSAVREQPLAGAPLQTAQVPPLLPENVEDAPLSKTPSLAVPPVAAVKKRRTLGLQGRRAKDTTTIAAEASLPDSQHIKRKLASAAGPANLPKRPRTQVRRST